MRVINLCAEVLSWYQKMCEWESRCEPVLKWVLQEREWNGTLSLKYCESETWNSIDTFLDWEVVDQSLRCSKQWGFFCQYNTSYFSLIKLVDDLPLSKCLLYIQHNKKWKTFAQQFQQWNRLFSSINNVIFILCT